MKTLSLIALIFCSLASHSMPIANLNSADPATVVNWEEEAGAAPLVWMPNGLSSEWAEPEVDDEDLEEGIADDEAAEYDFQQWIWGEASQDPSMFMENVDVKDKAKLVIEVLKKSQIGKVWYNGKLLIKSFKVSTGLSGKSETPAGVFKPGARKVNWLSGFATRKYGRKIYLKWAVQISGGSFMHAASAGAMAHLGKKRSAGCVRVPPQIAARVYKLVQENPGRAVFYVH